MITNIKYIGNDLELWETVGNYINIFKTTKDQIKEFIGKDIEQLNLIDVNKFLDDDKLDELRKKIKVEVVRIAERLHYTKKHFIGSRAKANTIELMTESESEKLKILVSEAEKMINDYEVMKQIRKEKDQDYKQVLFRAVLHKAKKGDLHRAIEQPIISGRREEKLYQFVLHNERVYLLNEREEKTAVIAVKELKKIIFNIQYENKKVGRNDKGKV